MPAVSSQSLDRFDAATALEVALARIVADVRNEVALQREIGQAEMRAVLAELASARREMDRMNRDFCAWFDAAKAQAVAMPGPQGPAGPAGLQGERGEK